MTENAEFFLLQIFGSRADANGTAMTDGTLDMTGEPLLESVA